MNASTLKNILNFPVIPRNPRTDYVMYVLSASVLPSLFVGGSVYKLSAMALSEFELYMGTLVSVGLALNWSMWIHIMRSQRASQISNEEVKGDDRS